MVDGKIFELCQSITENELDTLKNKECLANIKFDGERILAICQSDKVLLMNRRTNEKSSFFQEITDDLEQVDSMTILDGEIISHDDSFKKLSKRAHTKDKLKQAQLKKDIPVKFMVFDILIYKGINLMEKILKERIKYIKKLINEYNFTTIEMAEYKDIQSMLLKAKSENREGIIIKNMNSYYESRRSKDWLKLKFFKEGSIFATKYTDNPAGIRIEDDDGNAIQVSGSQAEEVAQKIDKTKRVEVYVQYLEKTEKGKMRFPSFRGIKT